MSEIKGILVGLSVRVLGKYSLKNWLSQELKDENTLAIQIREVWTISHV